jgi:hypothetical protein
MTWMETINDKVAASAVGHWFQLEGSGHVSAPSYLLASHQLPVIISEFFCC